MVQPAWINPSSTNSALHTSKWIRFWIYVLCLMSWISIGKTQTKQQHHFDVMFPRVHQNVCVLKTHQQLARRRDIFYLCCGCVLVATVLLPNLLLPRPQICTNTLQWHVEWVGDTQRRERRRGLRGDTRQERHRFFLHEEKIFDP